MNTVTLKILFMIAVGSGIGYATNVIAIVMLFRPYKPIKFPLIKWQLHGLIPKRREEIAKSIGETVKNELISMEEINSQLLTDENKRKLVDAIKAKVKTVVAEKTESIPFGLGSVVSNMVDDIVEVELTIFIYDQSEEMINDMTKDIDIGLMVEDKINQFELKKIEDIILKVASRELRHIELLGGILGAFIGLIQGIIVTLI
mgnify:FL=1